MNVEFDDILPEEISDETAYHLADIFMNLALAIESRYLAQIKRYVDENNPPDQDPSVYVEKQRGNNDPG